MTHHDHVRDTPSLVVSTILYTCIQFPSIISAGSIHLHQPGFRVPPHKMRHRHANISTARSHRAIAITSPTASQPRKTSLTPCCFDFFVLLFADPPPPLSRRFVLRLPSSPFLSRCLLTQSPSHLQQQHQPPTSWDGSLLS